MSKIKKFLILIIFLLFIVIIGYLVHSCSNLQNKNIDLQKLINKSYMSRNGMYEITFLDSGYIEYRDNSAILYYSYKYDDNIFELQSGDSIRHVAVIDIDRLYLDSNIYLYLLE